MRKEITVTINGEEVTLSVIKPSAEIGRESQFYYGKIFAQALKSGAILRASLNNHLREQKLWNDERQKQDDDFKRIIEEGLDKLAKGGIKLSEARNIAISIRTARRLRQLLLIDRYALDTNTVEGQAENARFDFLVHKCLVYNNGEQYYKKVEDYITDKDSEVAILAANTLYLLLYGTEEDFEKSLPENQFLIKWKFLDDKLRLVDKQGRLVDEQGKLINEDGQYINEDGTLVEAEKPIETQPFLDDDGKPIAE